MLPRCAALALVPLIHGCATLPEVVPLIAATTGGPLPAVIDARGPVSSQRQDEILRNLVADGQDGMLNRQLAVVGTLAPEPLVVGNRVSLLEDGPVIDDAMLRAMDRATNHINLETFILADDEVGHRVADMLVKKRAQGVRVNLIYDSFGSIWTPEAMFERLRNAGVRLLEFNPLNPFVAERDWAPNTRDHRKLLVVDGAVAIIGGANIRKPEAVQGETRWRDTDIQIEGPAVARFQALFMQTWAEQGGETLCDANYFPLLPEMGDQLLKVLGGTSHTSPIFVTLLSAIMAAKQTVYLTTAYFVPDPQLLFVIESASRRGVDVQLVLPNRSDFRPALAAGRSYFQELLDAGVRIYERQDAVLHAKTAVIDGIWSTVGSTNLDRRSLLFNREINAVMLGRSFALRMEQLFRNDVQRSMPIEKSRWPDRPLANRIGQWFARLFGYWW